MNFKLAAAVCLAALSTASIAQGRQLLNNQSILKMHEAGMSDGLVITTINAQPGAYTTATDDLIALKKAGIGEQVIAAMVVKGNVPTALAVSAAATPGSLPSQPSLVEPVGKPRVFLVANSHGPNRNAVRDQSMEMSKDVEQQCPAIRVTLNQQMADYTLSLNHIEVGLLIRDNQFQIADKNGDLISKTKEGGSILNGVKKACGAILANWDQIHPSPAVNTLSTAAPTTTASIQ